MLEGSLKLTNENIDSISDACAKFFESNDIKPAKVLQNRLALEEILIKYQNEFGEDTDVSYRTTKRFGKLNFIVSIESKEFDPFYSKDENSVIINNLLSNYEKGEPYWNYSQGTNKISITCNKKVKFGLLPQVIAAIVLAIVGGLIIQDLLDKDTINTIVESYLNPIANVYTGLLCVTAVLFVFLNIAISISDLGDLSSAGKMSRHYIGKYLLLVPLITVCVALPFIFFCNSGEHDIVPSFNSIYDLFISFFPGNLVQPFIDFNSIQILIIGAIFGIAMVALGDKTNNLKKVFIEVRLVAIEAANFFAKLIAVFVFLTLFSYVANTEKSVIRYSVRLLIMVFIGLIVIMAFYTAIVSIRLRISPIKYLKKVMPCFLLAISTANMGACFGININTEIADLGVDGNYSSFGIQTGVVLYRPAQAFVYLVSAMYIADFYNIRVNPVWFVISAILCMILTIATPTIPTGAAAMFPLLLTQLGLPFESRAWMVALSSILIFPTYAIDNFALQSEVLLVANHDKMVNRDALLK